MKKRWVVVGFAAIFVASAIIVFHYQNEKGGTIQTSGNGLEVISFTPFSITQESAQSVASSLFYWIGFSDDWAEYRGDGNPKNYPCMKYRSMDIPLFPQDYEIKLVGKAETINTAENLNNISKPRFSPDGSKLVFCAGPLGRQQVFRVGINGEGLQQLTSSKYDSIDPDWMSDGTGIVYSSNQTGNYEIWRMDKNGKSHEMISKEDGANKLHPRCSPIDWANSSEESALVLFEYQNGKTADLWAIGANGKIPFSITEKIQGIAKYSNAEWSPNGVTILYNAQIGDSMRVGHGWNFTNSGEDAKPVIPEIPMGGQAFYPQVFPNLTKMCFMRMPEDEYLYYSAVNGTHINKLKLSHKIKGPVALSPDGKLIAYVKAPIGKGGLEIQKIQYPLQDVLNLWQYPTLKAKQLQKLQQNHFVVTGEENELFHIVYDTGGYHGEFGYQIPSFITTDTTLELFHLFFDYTLKKLETDRLRPLLNELLESFLKQIDIESRRTDLTKEIRSDLESWRKYLHVGKVLSGLGVKIPKNEKAEQYNSNQEGEPDTPADLTISQAEIDEIEDPAIRNEVRLIVNHTGSGRSILQEDGSLTDYTQYTVRGHYSTSRELAAYFRTMMWLSYGYSIEPDEKTGNEDQRKAMVIATILKNNDALLNQWKKIFSPMDFFAGEAEDITLLQVVEIMTQATQKTDLNFCQDPEVAAAFARALGDIPRPKIAPFEKRQLRLFPQRFTPDSYIHQSLVPPDLPHNPQTMEGRHLPKGLDIMAVFGSERAFQILDKVLDETHYYLYAERVKKLREEFTKTQDSEWRKNLYWRWLYSLVSLIQPFDERYPDFMQTPAWLDKSLNTALASWTELRHDTILYVKQPVSAEGGEGAEGWEPEIPIPRGYVEPNVAFYSRLESLVQAAFEDLASLEIEDTYAKELITIIQRLKVISEKELKNEMVSDEDIDFILRYGSEMEYLTAYYKGGIVPFHLGQVALIADVASDGNALQGEEGAYLHEAVGNVRTMYVEVQTGKTKQITRGGVFSYYEFPVSGKRLTDDEWRKMLQEKKNPDRPIWTDSFISE